MGPGGGSSTITHYATCMLALFTPFRHVLFSPLSSTSEPQIVLKILNTIIWFNLELEFWQISWIFMGSSDKKNPFYWFPLCRDGCSKTYLLLVFGPILIRFFLGRPPPWEYGIPITKSWVTRAPFIYQQLFVLNMLEPMLMLIFYDWVKKSIHVAENSIVSFNEFW